MTQQDISVDNRKTIKTAFWNTIANVISLTVGTVMVPIITRVISQEELGIASTFVANRNTLVILATLAIYAFVNRAMIEFPNNQIDFIFSTSIFIIIAVVVCFIVSFPFKQVIMHLLSLDEFLYYWLFVSMACFSLYSVASYYCIFKNYSYIVFAIVLTVGPVSQLLSVALAYAMPGVGHIGRVVGLDAVYVLVSFILIACLLRTKLKTTSRAYSGTSDIVFRPIFVKKALLFSVPLIPHLLSQMVLTQCDLTMISYITGPENSGIYSMGHTVSNLAYTVMTQLMAAWSPWVYRRIQNGNIEAVKKNSSMMLVLGAYLSCGLMTIAPELIHLFLPSSYEPTTGIIAPLTMAMFLSFIYLFFYDLEYFYKKTHWIAIASIITAILNIALNLLLLPRFGYLIACYLTAASYAALVLLNLFFALKLNALNTYNFPVLAICTISVLAYTVFVQFSLSFILLRYIAMASTTLALLILFKKPILNMLSTLQSKEYRHE